MGRITDADYLKEYKAQPEAAMAKFGLDEPWQQRVAACDPDSMAFLARSWEGLSREMSELEDEHKQREWAAWANILQQEANMASVNQTKTRTGGIDQQAGVMLREGPPVLWSPGGRDGPNGNCGRWYQFQPASNPLIFSRPMRAISLGSCCQSSALNSSRLIQLS